MTQLPALPADGTLRYRLARFDRLGMSAPEAAAKIDRSITASWPQIRAAFTLEAQAELFAKIHACNLALAKVFEDCDLLLLPSLGVEACVTGSSLACSSHAYFVWSFISSVCNTWARPNLLCGAVPRGLFDSFLL
jgi:hypothetical protein